MVICDSCVHNVNGVCSNSSYWSDYFLVACRLIPDDAECFLYERDKKLLFAGGRAGARPLSPK